MSEKKHVLFVCIENSCRSQMAEAFAHLYAQDAIEAYSAGSRPSGQVNPKAITAMAELGYDLSAHHSKPISEVASGNFDYVISMGCGDECPFVLADKHIDWDIPDPKQLPMDQFRKVRDLIGEQVKELVKRIEVSQYAGQ